MFADVVGSTSFFQKYGDVQGRLFIQRHHDILSPLVSAHGGRVVKTIGDAVMAAFEEPQRALDCALAMQQKLWETNQNQPEEEDPRLQTKISLHYGSALVAAPGTFACFENQLLAKSSTRRAGVITALLTAVRQEGLPRQ